ncbi:aminopeptidase [Candidatus Bathyarchaeota archaeon]|nr:aminopeptidase [Candidatus Bathyarchaeota archaeon]RJS90293.1 MAG: aminopeptidase [Candidatus Bathyarchaeota archaeon]
MPKLYEFELGKAADILTRELFKLKEGEIFVITADTESDERVVEATARAAFALGAKPMVIWLASPLGVGKAADPMLPQEALVGALKGADAWVEFNNEWLLYSTTYDIVMKENKKLRYLCLVGMNADMMVRCIGRIDYPLLGKFLEKITELTKKAKEMRITTPAGCDVTFRNPEPMRIGYSLGYADTPGSHMMAGQIGWAPVYETINGKIVFDGSVVPPIGLLREPIELTVERGEIVKIEGGKEAVEFDTWLRSFNDPNMLKIAHICYGFNPGAKLTGDIVEDERVWGCVEWGIGNFPGRPAASHTDGICLNASVWLDGEQILDKGKCIHPELAELAKKLGKQ